MTPHIDQLIKKLSSSVYVIRRMNQISDSQTARTAYFALFESHLRYGLVAWGGTTAQNLHRVLVVQKRAMRALTGLNYRESCKEAFKEQRILTVVALYILETIIHAVTSNQTRLADQHHYNTRNRHNFLLESHHLSLYEKKPSYKGTTLFNMLPDHLKTLPARNLKTATKNWLLQHPIYSVREFLDWRNNAATEHP
uniref:Uncharacterized protein n=2 Tax=Graphocephala atropunctata TaxID=36148 RepID=A0A1B6LC00_9HEMI